jgi:hypothetical protein
MKNNKLLVLLFVLCFSCDREKQNTEQSIIESKNVISEKLKWDKITVKFSNVSYSIKFDTDSLKAKRWDTMDSLVNGSVYKTAINVRRRKFFVDANLKDSLSLIVFHIITKPVLTDNNSTCGVGKVDLFFDYGNLKLSCNYYGVGELSLISEDFKHLYDVLIPFTIPPTRSDLESLR